MESKQPSSFLYIALGAVAIGASLLIIFILFASGIFEVTFNNGTALLLVGIIYGISLFSLITLLYKWQEGPERARVKQSHLMLTIANETLSHLRKGFEPKTCQAVAAIIYAQSEVDAVAIIDDEQILGFAGKGQGELTFKNLKEQRGSSDEGVVDFEHLASKHSKHKRWSGVSVPLKMQGQQIGTLEFLQGVPKRLTENQIAVAGGLGELLGTQLELSQLDKQQELAVRSELKALRAQINPHFLFNTLNTIAALCRTDPQVARQLIIRFADFFRDPK